MASVVVTNISPALEERHLRELFECCGTIKELSLKPSEPRICNIEFDDPAHAQAAVLLSGTPLGDRGLVVKTKQEADTTFESMLAKVLAPMTKSTSGSSDGLGFSWPIMEAAKKRQEEVARTVYVGNLNFDIDTETLRKFFGSCGEICYVKLVGDTVGWTGRFAFVEFKTLEGANMALNMTGALIGDRPIKVGRSNNPIIKQGGIDLSSSSDRKGKTLDEIMAKVREATQSIAEKVEKKSRSRSRSRGRRRKKHGRRSRSGSGGRRGRRSRSRSRGRRRGERRGRRSRTPPPAPVRRSPPKKKEQVDRTGMFFDGYTWQPIVDVALKNPGAILLSQQSTQLRRKPS